MEIYRPTNTLAECITNQLHMSSSQPGFTSEGTYVEECTNCGELEYI